MVPTIVLVSADVSWGQRGQPCEVGLQGYEQVLQAPVPAAGSQDGCAVQLVGRLGAELGDLKASPAVL